MEPSVGTVAISQDLENRANICDTGYKYCPRCQQLQGFLDPNAVYLFQMICFGRSMDLLSA